MARLKTLRPGKRTKVGPAARRLRPGSTPSPRIDGRKFWHVHLRRNDVPNGALALDGSYLTLDGAYLVLGD